MNREFWTANRQVCVSQLFVVWFFSSSGLKQESTACLAALFCDGQLQRVDTIERSDSSTHQWLSTDRTFLDWTASKSSTIRIVGKPGSGKSTLSKHVFYTTRDRLSQRPGAVIAGFFFHDRGAELGKSEEGFLRGILYQILSQLPSLFGHILPTYERKAATENPLTWSVEFLHDVLKAVLGDPKIREVVFIIDALDECLGSSKDAIIAIIAGTLTAHPSSRIMITSRPESAIEGRLGHHSPIQLHTENTADIKAYINETLKDSVVGNSSYDQIEVKKLIEEIITRSQGVFLWVNFVVQELRNESDGGSSISKLKAALNTVPGSLWGIYERILGRLEMESESEGMRMLEWVLFAARPLGLIEFRYAIAVGAPGFTSFDKSDIITATESQFEKRLLRASGGLLELGASNPNVQSQYRTVQLIHQSAKDYLSNVRATASPSAGMTVPQAHTRLARDCASFMISSDLVVSWWTVRWAPFMEYAVIYWTHHARLAEKGRIHMARFGWPSRDKFTTWQSLSKRSKTRDWKIWGSPLGVAGAIGSVMDVKHLLEFRNSTWAEYAECWQMASHSGQGEVIRFLLADEGDRRPRGTSLEFYIKIALDAAARGGYTELVGLCIHNMRERPRTAYGGSIVNDTLITAAEHGSLEMVQLLVREGGADVNWEVEGPVGVPQPRRTPGDRNHGYAGPGDRYQGYAGPGDRYPGYAGPGDRYPGYKGPGDRYQGYAGPGDRYQGSKSPMELLNIPAAGHTALQAAARRSHREITKLLIERGANVNHQDPITGATPLYEAALRGDLAIMKLLIEKGADINGPRAPVHRVLERRAKEQQHHRPGYRTIISSIPLQMAAMNGQTEAVKLFLAHGADVNSADSTGHTALHIAIDRGHVGVAEVLIAHGCNLDPLGEVYGTPMHNFASSYATLGSIDVANLLISEGADIDRKNRDGLTALELAARWGNWEVAWVLIASGAVVDLGQASTAASLWTAAYRGYSTVVYEFIITNTNTAPSGFTDSDSEYSCKSVFLPLLRHTALAAVAGPRREASFVDTMHKDSAQHHRQPGVVNNIAFLSAAAAGHGKIVEFFLDDNPVFHGGIHADNGMLLAAAYGRPEVAHLLTGHEPRFELPCMRDGTALLVAAANSKTEMVQVLLDCGACVDISGPQYRYMVHLAVGRGEYRTARLLIHIGTQCVAVMDAGGKRAEAEAWVMRQRFLLGCGPLMV